MPKKLIVSLSLLAVSIVCAPLTQAAPLTWSLQGVTFADGGTASGSFAFDATANTYSSINMVTTSGTLPGASYTNLGFGNPIGLIALQTAGAPQGSTALQMLFASSLTDAGGTVAIVLGSTSFEASCNSSGTCAFNPARLITAGEVTAASAVPEPATAALIPAAMLALAIARRRRAR